MTPDNKRIGYFKCWREMFYDDEFISDPKLLIVFLHLLARANRKSMMVKCDGEDRLLPPGSLVIGIRSMADKLGMTKDAFARRVNRLKARDTIETETRQEGTVVSFANWSTYQVSEEEGETEARQKPTPTRIENKEKENNTSPDEGDLTLLERSAKTRPQYSPAFEELWGNHPKGNKADAYRAWLREAKRFPLSDIIKAVTNYLAECDIAKQEPKYRKDLSTLLNKERFVEYIDKQPVTVFTRNVKPLRIEDIA